MSETATLAEFLLERLDDVEGAITYHTTFGAASYEGHQCFDFQTPEFIRADCEAKRQIVEEHGDQHACVSWELASAEPYVGCSVLRLLALPFANHPDYRPEWRQP